MIHTDQRAAQELVKVAKLLNASSRTGAAVKDKNIEKSLSSIMFNQMKHRVPMVLKTNGFGMNVNESSRQVDMTLYYYDEDMNDQMATFRGRLEMDKPSRSSSSKQAGGRKVNQVIELMRKKRVDPDDASPNFVSQFAADNYIPLTSREIVEISDSYEAKNASSKQASAGLFHRDGQKIYVDTNFIRNSSGVLPGSSLEHMGFGEFYIKSSDGDVQFDRGRGKDFEGQSGRSHLLYDDKNGVLMKKLLKAMIAKGEAIEV